MITVITMVSKKTNTTVNETSVMKMIMKKAITNVITPQITEIMQIEFKTQSIT